MYSTALHIVKVLRDKGFEAYFAGGMARDILLGKPHKDIDIATSAKPEQIEALFSKTYPIGKQFGVILVYEEGHTFEVATFRSDSGYSDGRRPDYITFTNAREDAWRRDFTINGMFYDPLEDIIIDYVDGRKDLEARVIRFIGDPVARVQEDHLRLLRAVRFAHQIEGGFEPATYAAVKENAHLIKDISAERIMQELSKILLLGSRGKALEDLQDLHLLSFILPEVEKLKGIAQPKKFHTEGSVWDHAVHSIATLKGADAEDIALIWAVLLHDIGKVATFHVDERIRYNGHAEVSAKMAKEIMTRLKFPKMFSEKISWAIERHMSLEHLISEETSELSRRKLMTHPWFDFLLSLHKADASGTSPADLSLYDALSKMKKKILDDIPVKLPKLISGSEISELMNIEKGPELGKILSKIQNWQLLGEVSTKDDIIARLKSKKL